MSESKQARLPAEEPVKDQNDVISGLTTGQVSLSSRSEVVLHIRMMKANEKKNEEEQCVSDKRQRVNTNAQRGMNLSNRHVIKVLLGESSN